MTCTVSSGTLNSTIPYHTTRWILTDEQQTEDTYQAVGKQLIYFAPPLRTCDQQVAGSNPVELSYFPYSFFGTGATNLNEPPRAFATSTIAWVRS